MKKLGAMACVAGLLSGAGAMWAPRSAEADIVTPDQRSNRGKDCAYDNLSCTSGSDSCIVCGSGSDTTCKEDHTSCNWLTAG